MLLKNENQIFRVLQTQGDKSLVIDCIKKTMPKWGPLREFCVSVFRQNQEYHVINVHDEGLFPLVTFLPEGWDGMRAGTA